MYECEYSIYVKIWTSFRLKVGIPFDILSYDVCTQNIIRDIGENDKNMCQVQSTTMKGLKEKQYF